MCCPFPHLICCLILKHPLSLRLSFSNIELFSPSAFFFWYTLKLLTYHLPVIMSSVESLDDVIARIQFMDLNAEEEAKRCCTFWKTSLIPANSLGLLCERLWHFLPQCIQIQIHTLMRSFLGLGLQWILNNHFRLECNTDCINCMFTSLMKNIGSRAPSLRTSSPFLSQLWYVGTPPSRLSPAFYFQPHHPAHFDWPWYLDRWWLTNTRQSFTGHRTEKFT